MCMEVRLARCPLVSPSKKISTVGSKSDLAASTLQSQFKRTVTANRSQQNH